MDKALMLLIICTATLGQPVTCPKTVKIKKGDEAQFNIRTNKAFSCQWEIINEDKNYLEIIIDRADVVFNV